MYCYFCGNEVDENDRVCTKCGNILKEDMMMNNYVDNRKKSNVGLVVGLIIVAVIAIGVAIGVAINSSNSSHIAPSASPEPNAAVKPKENFYPDNTNATHTVTLNFDVQKNHFVAKYDVDIYIQDKFYGTLSNGETRQINLDIPDGCYNLKLKKHTANKFFSDDSFVATDAFVVDGDNCSINYFVNLNVSNLKINRKAV